MRIPRSRTAQAIVIMLGVLVSFPAWAARPLATEDTGTLDPGSLELEIGLDYLRGGGAQLFLLPGGHALNFGVLPGLPSIDPGGTPPGDDPIRLGAGSLLTFTSHGSSSSGTVYIRGRFAQYAVRVFGDTGKSRILKFHNRTRRWSAA